MDVFNVQKICQLILVKACSNNEWVDLDFKPDYSVISYSGIFKFEEKHLYHSTEQQLYMDDLMLCSQCQSRTIGVALE
jgi:hypothetical protein